MLALPLKCDEVNMPNNIESAKKQLLSLARSLLWQPKHLSSYIHLMKKLFSDENAVVSEKKPNSWTVGHV